MFLGKYLSSIKYCPGVFIVNCPSFMTAFIWRHEHSPKSSSLTENVFSPLHLKTEQRHNRLLYFKPQPNISIVFSLIHTKLL